MVSVEVQGPTAHFETRVGSDAEARERLSTGYERLKPGPAQSPEQVRTSQRSRIQRAMVELAGELGGDRVTVRALTRTAGVSSRTFYGHFDNREECLAAAVDSVGYEFLRRAARSESHAVEQAGRLKASLNSLLGDLAACPKAARVLLVEAVAGGRSSRMRATELTADLERLLAYLLSGGSNDPPSQSLVVGVAGGVVRVATMTTLTGRAGELAGLSDNLGDWVLARYDEERTALPHREGKRLARRKRREPSPLPVELSAVEGHGEDERILSAAVKLAMGNGFDTLTVSKIRREAGVSRRSFDARFAGSTDCFLAAVESIIRTAAGKAVAWAGGTTGNRQFNYRVALALCAIVARNQPQARMVLTSILAAGRDGLQRRERLISEAAQWLIAEHPASVRQKSIAAEASIAAAWRIAQREVDAGGASNLPRSATVLSRFVSAASAGVPFDFAPSG